MTLAEHIEWMCRLDREMIAVKLRPILAELDAVMSYCEQRWPIRRPTFINERGEEVRP